MLILPTLSPMTVVRAAVDVSIKIVMARNGQNNLTLACPFGHTSLWDFELPSGRPVWFRKDQAARSEVGSHRQKWRCLRSIMHRRKTGWWDGNETPVRAKVVLLWRSVTVTKGE